MIFIFFQSEKYHRKFKSSESESAVMNELTRYIHECYAVFFWWESAQTALWNEMEFTHCLQYLQLLDTTK